MAGKIDDVEVESPLQVAARLGIAGHDQLRPIGRPVETAHVPGSARELGGLASAGRHDE